MTPYLLRHLVLKEFRSTPEARAVAARLQTPEFHRPAHDVYCEMFLEGYQEATKSRVARSTGLALVLFMVFIFTFDQEFERGRRSGGALDYRTVIAAPQVAAVWNALAEYLHAFGRDDEVVDYLESTFATYYDDYRRHVGEAVADIDFAKTHDLAELDSGRTLMAVYDIIRLFNGHRSDSRCASQFFALGMAGKFLDDLRDMVDDVTAGDPNLLHALTAENHHEQTVLQTAMREGSHINMWWWMRNCPVTLESYLQWTSRYYEKVTAPKLRLPLDMCLGLLYSRRYWRTPIHRRPTASP